MANQKWGESFLKSGLPLEHLTLLALKSIGWECELHYEYFRLNREKQPRRFEHDVISYSPWSNNGNIRLLIECKYHDQSRFWFFLPCETEDHLAQYGALSAGENLNVNSKVIHSAPYECLSKPETESLLNLAPKCVWGVTVSMDGTRQPNAVDEATKQLAFGFVPYCLDSFYGFHNSSAISTLPVIVTSARLFRLRPSVNSFDAIRRANSPDVIADELPWLWYYHAPNGDLLDHNMDEIDAYKKQSKYADKKIVADQLIDLWSFPHWIAVLNIDAVASAVTQIYNDYSALPKNFSGDKLIATIWKQWKRDRAEQKRK